MLTLALALALAQTPQHMLHRQPNLPRGPGYAFFEAFPLSGAGTTSACSTTAPTGAKGEALTFTRTGNATCSKKGLATTGIADGDLVVMSGNVARVEPDADGVLGLRVEGSRQNLCLRSEALDNASWVYVNTGAAAPTFLGADLAVAPDGAQTADGFTFQATTAGQDSARQSTTSASCPVGTTCTFSIYVRGVSTSGTTDLCAYGSTAGVCTACAFVSTSWTRCVLTTSGSGSGNMGLLLGNSTRFNGGTVRSAASVYAWGGMMEVGSYATSYIPTVAAAVTRNAEAASFTLPSAIGPSFSLGVSMWWPSSSVGAVTALQLGTGAPDLARIGRNTNTAATLLINATTTTPAVSAIGTTQQRGTLNDNAGTRTATWQGASVAAPASSMTGTTTALSIGALDGIVTKVCVDPVAGRCTP